eukprot:CAMPEP_0119073284 /NCGR_PEP_ID=MMETSP1178-20130426/63738_1 /TAXON_ID=33656 /ORGANISM="unid sp, Strain CCMP2000" /LENGTH=272 /DNA_ID=CAMNT_0007055349 /DNA_START=53 /DNA_END=871 /DNA_ORIENTATION=-
MTHDAQNRNEELLLDLVSVSAAAKQQTVTEQLGVDTSILSADSHEQLTARRMLTAMFPWMDHEVLNTVLSWNGGNVDLAASSILDMCTEGESTPDDSALARVLQRTEAGLETVQDEEQLRNDEEICRELQAAWQAEEEEHARSSAIASHANTDSTKRGRMLAFLRSRGAASSRLLNDGDKVPREIAPSVGDSTLLSVYAPPPAQPMALAEATTTQPLSAAAAPEARYASRVQRAKKANLARGVSSDGMAPLLALCGQNPAGGSLVDWPPAII